MAEVEREYYDIGVYCFRSEPVSSHDQTETIWLEMSHEWAKGTGIFLLNEPDSRIPGKVLLPNLTYKDFKFLGENLTHTRWVPNWTESFENLEESARECLLSRALAAEDK